MEQGNVRIRRLTPSQKREMRVGYLFVVPALTCIIVFVFIPIVRSLILSLYDYDVVSKRDFIGLNNFAAMAQDPKWMQALQKTLLYVVMFVPSMLVISLLLALMIKHISRFSGFFRTTFFMPIIVSSTAAGAIFKMVFNKKTGFVNLFIQALGGGCRSTIDIGQKGKEKGRRMRRHRIKLS